MRVQGPCSQDGRRLLDDAVYADYQIYCKNAFFLEKLHDIVTLVGWDVY